MSIVKVDERGRMTIPKGFNVRGSRVVLIPAGSFMIMVPVPPNPIDVSGGWLKTRLDRGELKAKAERVAHKDAVERARRRRQM